MFRNEGVVDGKAVRFGVGVLGSPGNEKLEITEKTPVPGLETKQTKMKNRENVFSSLVVEGWEIAEKYGNFLKKLAP